MAQHWIDVFAWEAVLNDNPQLRGIVEIGTFKGGMSLYLRAQALVRNMDFRTYDVFKPEVDVPGFRKLDVFADPTVLGSYLVEADPVALFCDGGNKARELRTFSNFLTKESIILVHDWGTEFFSEDVPANVYPVYEEWFERFGSPTRAFRVR